MKKEQIKNPPTGLIRNEASTVSPPIFKRPPDPAKAIIYIEQIDFTKLINNLVESNKWNRRVAEQVCRQYRNFLFLMVKYPEKILFPTTQVKEFWCNHILNTQQYFNDCMAIFGHYLHFFPYVSRNQVQESFAETRRLYWQEFGEEFPEMTSRFSWLKRLIRG